MAYNRSSIILLAEDSALRALQLQQEGGGFRVSARAEAQLPSGVIEKGSLLRKSYFTDVLSSMLNEPQEGSFQGSSIVLSLCDRLFVQRQIRAQASHDKRHALLKRIACAHFGGDKPLFCVQGHDEDHFSMTAVHPSELDTYRSSLEDAGLDIDQVLSHSASLLHGLYEDQQVSEPVLGLYIGANRTNAFLADAFGLHQTDHVPFGTSLLEQTLARAFQVHPLSARAALRRAGLDRQHEGPQVYYETIQDQLKPVLRALTDLRTLAQLYQYGDLSLVVTGQGAALPGLAEFLQEETGLPLRRQTSSVPLNHQCELADRLELEPLLGAAMTSFRRSAIPHFTTDHLFE